MSKILELRLPDPILRKALKWRSVGESKMKFRRIEAGEAVFQNAREAGDGWYDWEKWKARYIEMTTGYDVENRLRSDLDINSKSTHNSEPAHEKINNNTRIAAQLFSLCRKDLYDETAKEELQLCLFMDTTWLNYFGIIEILMIYLDYEKVNRRKHFLN